MMCGLVAMEEQFVAAWIHKGLSEQSINRFNLYCGQYILHTQDYSLCFSALSNE